MLTVLMTVHNGSRYLNEALNSLTSQEFSDFDVVVVDDASTDESVSIARSFIGKLDLNIVSNPRNFGITRSLKRGLGLAKTQSIVIFDQDDICAPRRTAEFARAFGSGAKLITSSYLCIDRNSEICGDQVSPPIYLDQKNFYWELIKRNYFLGSAMGFDAASLKLLSLPDDSSMATDYAIALQLSRSCQDIVFIKDSLLYYRVHEGNTSRNFHLRDRDAKFVLRNSLQDTFSYDCTRLEEIGKIFALMVAYQFIGEISLSGRAYREIRGRLVKGAYLSDLAKAEYHFYEAAQLYFERDYLGAMTSLNNIEMSDSLAPIILNNLGCIYSHLKLTNLASMMFRLSALISPAYRDAQRNLSLITRAGDVAYTSRYPRPVWV